MRLVAFDTETALIRPALLAPPMVCLTWQEPGKPAQIAHWTEAEPIIRGWLEDPTVVLVGHNVAYDLAVIVEAYPALRQAVFDAYDADRVACTQIRQQLLDIAAGVYRRKHVGRGVFVKQEYTLEALARRCASMELQKDAWRLSYSEFLDCPLEQWPTRAREVQARAVVQVAELREQLAALKDKAEIKALTKRIEGLDAMIASAPEQCVKYPLDDARATLAVYLAQEQHATPWLADQHRQACAAFALHLSSAWGLRTDEPGVQILRDETARLLDEVLEELIELGLVREDGTRDTKLAKRRMLDVCKREGLVVPRTKTHGEGTKCELLDGTKLPDTEEGHEDCEEHVCLDGDACEATEDEALVHYSEFSQLKKTLSNDVVMLEQGIHWPVHTRYGLAATGRTTSSKPNIQNVTKREGLRECYVARPGKVFIQADFPTLELYTLAQCCLVWLGRSKLAEALNNGLDPHTWVASIILETTYEDALSNSEVPEVAKARDLAKPANFGFPGGMGIKKFLTTTRRQMGRDKFAALFGTDPKDQIRRASNLKEQWNEAWPEMPFYFARVNELCDNDTGKALAETLFTGRFRGQASYCATCNNGFQALGSDCAKRAAWLIARAQYVETSSPLFNSRTVAFVHDEFIGEADDNDSAHDAAYELARLMTVGANTYLPDVPIPTKKMKPLLMRRWSKKAKPRFDSRGRLVPWA